MDKKRVDDRVSGQELAADWEDIFGLPVVAYTCLVDAFTHAGRALLLAAVD